MNPNPSYRLTRTRRIFHQSGLTLIEMMIATALITIIAIGFAGAFGNVAKALQFSRSRTLAANLAQEQMQIIKQKSFNRILVTTATVYVPDFGSDVPYDNGYYVPEHIVEGGVDFYRYTFVQVVTENSGTLNYYGAVPDTGMKAVMVSVVWRPGGEPRKYQLRNVVSNIDTTMTNAKITGKVKIWSTSTGINNANVTIAENVGYEDSSNSSGIYSINVYPGNYTLEATARGYFPARATVSVAPNSNANQDFNLIPMASGTVRGSAWINNHLLISQVVASTVNAAGYSQEYVEVFNPSTWTWTIGNGPGSSVVRLMYQRWADASPTEIRLDYNNLSVGPGAYYLFANTSPVVVAGISKIADAVFQPVNVGYPDLIWDVANTGGSGVGDADAIGIALVGAPQPMDVIGWSKTSVGHQPNKYEGNAFPQNIGFQDGEQYVRRSSTTGVTLGVGRAYDTNDNSVDFIGFGSLAIPPNNTSSPLEPIVAGAPAVGAYVTATDGLSQDTNCYLTGSPPYAEFQLTSVATGTWIVFIASGSSVVETSTVTVAANATTSIPNANTVPAWPISGVTSSILSYTATQGFIAGWVWDVLGNPISPAIRVSAAGTYVQADGVSGKYFYPINPGTYDVTANNNNFSSLYVSQTSQTVSVELGQVTAGVNFMLSQGGRVRGSATRDGINPLPGISFVALDTNDMVRAQAISGADGRFYLSNVTTGTYHIEPVLGSGESSTPDTIVSTITAGSTIDVGTYTITGSFGNIRGAVTEGGTSIRTGVLIVCTTATITSPPPLSQNTLSGTAFYTTNSYEDGTYSLDVRGSTVAYKVYAYYTKFNVSNPTTTVRNASGVLVSAGLSTTGINFAW